MRRVENIVSTRERFGLWMEQDQDDCEDQVIEELFSLTRAKIGSRWRNKKVAAVADEDGSGPAPFEVKPSNGS